MFARITPYQLKPGSIDDAMAKAEELKPRIMALPGMLSWTNAVNDEGKGYIVATLTDRASSEGNVDKVKALWGEMTEYLAEMPVAEAYDHVQHWDS